MNKNIIKKFLLGFALLICGYLSIGYFLHLVVFPEKKPELSGIFIQGRKFFSKKEGLLQTVEKHENEHVHCQLEMYPFAGGPPKHIHTGFDEYVEIENGELTVWINGAIKKVHPGEKLEIPRGTPHQIYNETADTIRFKGSFPFPEKFAYNLVQIYGFMDSGQFGKMPATLFQISMLQSNGFDSYLAEGPPVFIQKTLGFTLTPLARLLGYKSYNIEYDQK